MTVKDVVYNTIAAGDGHAAIAVYFSDHSGLCNAESLAQRRPGEVVAEAIFEGVSSSQTFVADTYSVGPTDPRVDVTLDTYDSTCMLVPGEDSASSGSIKVETAPSQDPIAIATTLTFAAQGQTLNGNFSAAFCPSITDRSGAGYTCAN